MVKLERARPEYIFLLFALVGGLALLATVTTFAGGNERMNYQRAVLLAGGHVAVAPAPMPGGIAEVLHVTDQLLYEGRKPPYRYTPAEAERLRSVPLAADRPAIVEPNAIAVLHPVAYLPQAPVMAVGLALGLTPLQLFWVGKVAGLAVGISLAFWAIRLAPRNRNLLAALALMPPVLFARSTLDADQLTNGIAFLFAALLAREIAAEGPVGRGRLAALAVTAFIFAQAKSAYLLLPLLALAIPAGRFGSPARRFGAVALIFVPGVIGSLAWMLALRQGYFSHAAYETWSGLVIPHRQLHDVLAAPLSYVAVMLRTLFTTPLVPKAVFDFLGVFGPPVSAPLWFDLAAVTLLAALLVSEPRVPGGPLDGARLRLAALLLAVVSVVIILTLLYLQWTRYGAPVIDGFNGRYLYPLAPVAVLLARGRDASIFRLSPAHWLVAIGLLSTGTTLWVTAQTY